MAPNDPQCATITFDTGVAQGSALSPLLFLIFMNALLGLLTELFFVSARTNKRHHHHQRAETAHIPRAQMRSAAAQEGGDSSNRTCRV
jgi:hypothetical protein